MNNFYQALPWILAAAGAILAGELIIYRRRRRAQRRRLQARIEAIFSHPPVAQASPPALLSSRDKP